MNLCNLKLDQVFATGRVRQKRCLFRLRRNRHISDFLSESAGIVNDAKDSSRLLSTIKADPKPKNAAKSAQCGLHGSRSDRKIPPAFRRGADDLSAPR